MNINPIAGAYDRLKRLYFGASLDENASFLLDKNLTGHCLVVGGGSGDILADLLQSDINRITYIDKSSKMLDLAKRKFTDDRVQYVCADYLAYPGDQYDTIVLPYLLSCFRNADDVLLKIKAECKSSTRLLVTDFRLPATKKSRAKYYPLKMGMHLFFALTTGIKHFSHDRYFEKLELYFDQIKTHEPTSYLKSAEYQLKKT